MSATGLACSSPDDSRSQSPEYWRAVWQRAKEASFLKNSQLSSARKWQEFYSRVSGLYAGVTGHDAEMGRIVCELLKNQGLIGPGSSLLDVGCGHGVLALPACKAGARVTALDCNPAMLETLHDRAAASGPVNLVIQCCSWDDHPQYEPYELVLASFFPESLGVRGLRSLEAWSSGHCALVLGTGHEALAFRRHIWEAVLGTPYPGSGFHLTCAWGWLSASGRHPRHSRLSWPVAFCQPLEQVVSFYQNYFAIFNCDHDAVERAVRRVLARHTRQGMVRARGSEEVAVVWWKPKQKDGRREELVCLPGGRPCAAA